MAMSTLQNSSIKSQQSRISTLEISPFWILMSLSSQLDNAAPTVHSVLTSRAADPADLDESVADPIDAREVFDLVRSELFIILIDSRRDGGRVHHALRRRRRWRRRRGHQRQQEVGRSVVVVNGHTRSMIHKGQPARDDIKNLRKFLGHFISIFQNVWDK